MLTHHLLLSPFCFPVVKDLPQTCLSGVSRNNFFPLYESQNNLSPIPTSGTTFDSSQLLKSYWLWLPNPTGKFFPHLGMWVIGSDTWTHLNQLLAHFPSNLLIFLKLWASQDALGCTEQKPQVQLAWTIRKIYYLIELEVLGSGTSGLVTSVV